MSNYIDIFCIKREGYTDIPMLIRVFASWDNPKRLKQTLEKEFNLTSIPGYKSTFDLTHGEDYTHAFVINNYKPSLSIPKENVVGLAWEPSSTKLLRIDNGFIDYVQKNMGKYLIGEKGKLPAPFESGYAFLNHNPMKDIIIPKTKLCSIIFSKKTLLSGHEYRKSIVESILKTNLPIDIWGRGCSTLENDIRLKGEFEQDSVLPYEDYQFHICIENSVIDHYFSEKIVNALLSECTPIYYGCKKINDYFPDQTISLKGNTEEDIKIISNCLNQPELHVKKIDRNKINDITNPFLHLSELFNT